MTYYPRFYPFNYTIFCPIAVVPLIWPTTRLSTSLNTTLRLEITHFISIQNSKREDQIGLLFALKLVTQIDLSNSQADA